MNVIYSSLLELLDLNEQAKLSSFIFIRNLVFDKTKPTFIHFNELFKTKLEVKV
jgi:hypothetical protein